MSRGKQKEKDGVVRGILMAHSILALHVLLIAVLVFLVLFFRGIVVYMPWIFLGGAVIIIGSGYLFYRRMKAERKTLQEMLNSPLFRGRSVEVQLLGGFASFKIGNSDQRPALTSDAPTSLPQLEDPQSARIRELSELARLLENDLITLEEYNQVKQQLFK